jgi:hypothetical protein
MRFELEELAARALEEADLGAPVDPDVLAHRLGLRVLDGGPTCTGVLLPDGTVLVNDAERPERRAFTIAHEIAHCVLRSAGLEDDEPSANYLGAALLLPKDDFERDLRRCGWDLLHLRARHRLASFEALARRICALRDARMFVFDRPQDAPRRYYSVPWGLRPSDPEREAADEAERCGAPVEIVAGVTAWPVVEHGWHRVITLAAIEP